MKWIGNRVSYEDHKDFLTMIISSKTDHWKMLVMLIWFLIWLSCGLVIFYFLFFTQEIQDQKNYFYTFLVFWTYFLYKVIRVLIWRRFGIEFIRIDEDKFLLNENLLFIYLNKRWWKCNKSGSSGFIFLVLAFLINEKKFS